MLPIRLILQRLFIGKFSYTFQNNYRNSNGLIRSKKKYLQPCSKSDPVTHLIQAIHNHKELLILKTDKDIIFGDIQFDLSFRKFRFIRKRYRCYDIEKYGENLWRRIACKERIFNYGMLRVYHFLDNVFFFGELFFSDLRKIDDQKIAAALIEKYTGKKNMKVAGNFKIVGSGGYIFFENTGINLSIKYINNSNPEINSKIEEITQSSIIHSMTTRDNLHDLL